MISHSIDINQRIPLDTLDAALGSHLGGNYSNEYIIEQLRLEFSGENRLKKALRIVNKIVPNNPLNPLIIENSESITRALKNKVDRNIILISLLNSAFPFSYTTLHTISKLFTAQELLSREALRKHLSKMYGGNRATENAIDSVIPMFLEAGFFIRPKIGFYEWESPLIASCPISKTIYEESFKINNALAELQDYQMRDPYFVFVE